MMKKKLLLLLLTAITFGYKSNAQNVNIPDANFKAYLIGNTSINTNSDTEIQVSEAIAFTGNLDCQSQSISDLTGIEAFTNIISLNCRFNSLTSLNVSGNTSIHTITCNGNSISSLDLSNNSSLTSLICANNLLDSLDLTNNTGLSSLRCYGNNLTSLDLTQNPSLQSLECAYNSLTSLNTSFNPLLFRLECNNNNILSLDLSQNTALKWLYCYQNDLTFLDLDYNTALLTIECNNNNLTSLDLTQNTLVSRLDCKSNFIDTLDLSNNDALTYIFAYSNALTYLNVANGNNTIITTFGTPANPNLSCIEVDDVAYSTTNWTNIDAASSFSTDCNCTVNIPDANFKTYLLGNNSINTNSDTEIQCTEASAFTGTITCNNLNISDLTGIESFTSLTQLNCVGNQLTTIDVSNNLDMTFFNCQSNQITSLNLGNNTNLVSFYAVTNQLSAINVSACPNLYTISVSDNILTSIDVSSNSNLAYLYCYDNQLTSLNVSSNSSLESLTCNDNQITSIDVSMLPNLNELIANNNSLTVLNIANGNNSNITNNYFKSQSNPNLSCIEVDDITYSTSTWLNVDAGSSFSTGCAPVLVSSITVQGQSGNSVINTNGGTLQMETSVLPLNAVDVSYTWSVNNLTGSASIDVNGLLTANTNGTIDVIATANDASGITGNKTITISNQTVGINDISFNKFNIYPNPTNGFINLNVSETLSSIKLMDLRGKIIKEYNSGATQLDLSEFTPGIYFLEIANAEKKSIIKIIKKY